MLLHLNDAKSQTIQTDLALLQNNAEKIPPKRFRPYTQLKKRNDAISKINPINLVFSGLMFFYQNVLSSQINANCMYSPSCSEFSKCSIKQHGLVVGILLSADRLNRCNRITALEQIMYKPDINGKLPDECAAYKLKD